MYQLDQKVGKCYNQIRYFSFTEAFINQENAHVNMHFHTMIKVSMKLKHLVYHLLDFLESFHCSLARVTFFVPIFMILLDSKIHKGLQYQKNNVNVYKYRQFVSNGTKIKRKYFQRKILRQNYEL